jgi:hypothetical protein
MPADVEPSQLAELLDFAERPRTHDWSLRAALVRYAQPHPQRVNDVLDLVRRTEWALGRQAAVIERNGQELWAALEIGADAPAPAQLTEVVELLRAAMELDRLGDVLAKWAVDITGDRPDAEVDRVLADVTQRLDRLGVPHEERPPRARPRG